MALCSMPPHLDTQWPPDLECAHAQDPDIAAEDFFDDIGDIGRTETVWIPPDSEVTVTVTSDELPPVDEEYLEGGCLPSCPYKVVGEAFPASFWPEAGPSVDGAEVEVAEDDGPELVNPVTGRLQVAGWELNLDVYVKEEPIEIPDSPIDIPHSPIDIPLSPLPPARRTRRLLLREHLPLITDPAEPPNQLPPLSLEYHLSPPQSPLESPLSAAETKPSIVTLSGAWSETEQLVVIAQYECRVRLSPLPAEVLARYCGHSDNSQPPPNISAGFELKSEPTDETEATDAAPEPEYVVETAGKPGIEPDELKPEPASDTETDFDNEALTPTPEEELEPDPAKSDPVEPGNSQFEPPAEEAELVEPEPVESLANDGLVCPVCDRKFINKTGLKTHMSTIHQLGVTKMGAIPDDLACTVCQTACSSRLDYSRHWSSCHNASSQHKCSLCKKNFASRKMLIGHKRQAHPKDQTCSVCDKSYDARWKLNQHLATHDTTTTRPVPPDGLKCSLCKKNFATRIMLVGHKLRAHPKDQACSICNKSYDARWKLSQHLTTHDTTRHAPTKTKTPKPRLFSDRVVDIPDNLYCVQCDKTLVNAAHYRAHYLRMHTDCYPEPCKFCFNRFRTVELREAHERRNHPARACPTCGKIFYRKYRYSRHVHMCAQYSHLPQKASDDLTGESSMCSVCGLVLSQPSECRLHERLVHQLELQANIADETLGKVVSAGVECLQCQGVLPDWHGLRAHCFVTHGSATGDCVCDLCGARYARSKDLERHVERRHRRVTCSDCGLGFPSRKRLELHRKALHRVNDKFVCQLCGKSYARSNHLTDHLNEHNGIKPYTCLHCGEKFNKQWDKYNHIKAKHPEKIRRMANRPARFGSKPRAADTAIDKPRGKRGRPLGWRKHRPTVVSISSTVQPMAECGPKPDQL